MKVYLDYEERRHQIEEPEEEDGQFSDRGTDGIEWTPICIDTTATNGYSIDVDFIPESDTNVYLVTVRYSDGDTFGRTEGYWDIIKVCKTMKEAEKIKQGIRDQTYIMPGGYKPWDGYFASFDGVQIDSIPVINND